MAANAAVKSKPVTGSVNPWRGAYVIAFGNEKGGTGKTTMAVHIAVLLLKAGHKVSVIDLDSRQKTFARYMENRAVYAARKKHELPIPKVRMIDRSRSELFAQASAEEGANFERALNEARAEADRRQKQRAANAVAAAKRLADEQERLRLIAEEEARKNEAERVRLAEILRLERLKPPPVVHVQAPAPKKRRGCVVQ